MIQRYLYTIGFLICCSQIFAQVPDSIDLQLEQRVTVLDTFDVEQPMDSSALSIAKTTSRKKKKKRFLRKIFTEDYPNPKTALYLSLALPGTGQIYNKHWWKVPLVYGGMTWSIISIVNNTREFNRFSRIYIQALDGEPHEFSGTRIDSPDNLRRIRDGFDKNRQLSFVAVLLVYTIQGAEAFVAAHLKTFDVSDDLSVNMRLKPALEPILNNNIGMGIGVSFTLDNRKPYTPAVFLSE